MDLSSAGFSGGGQNPYNSKLLTTLFNQRKKVFMSSLTTLLEKLAFDPLTQQFLRTSATSQFISNRICELLSDIETDNREQYIQTLLMRIQRYERMISNQNKSLNQSVQMNTSMNQSTRRTIIDSDDEMDDNALENENERYKNIQILMEQCQRLKSENEQLKKRIQSKDDLISQLKEDAKYTYFKNSTQLFMNSTMDNAMQVVAPVNLSELHKQVKDVQIVIETIRKSFFSMIDQFCKMSHTSFIKAKMYASRAISLETSFKTKYYREKGSKEVMEKQNKRRTEIMKSQIEEKTNELNELKEENFKINSSLIELNQLKEDNTNEINDLKEENKQLNDDLIAEKHNNLKFIAQNRDLQNQVDQLKKQLAKEQNTLSATKEKLNEKIEKINNLKNSIESYNAQLKEKQKMNEKLEETVEDQKETIDKLSNDVKSKDNDTKGLKTLIKDMKTDQNENEDKINELERNIEDMKNKNKSLSKELIKKNDELVKLKKDFESIKQKKEDNKNKYQNEIKELNTQNDNLTTLVKQMKRKLKKTENQIKNLEQEKENNETTIQDLKEETNKNQKVIESSKKSHKEEYDKLKEELKKVNTTLQKKTQICEALSINLSSAHKENSDLQLKNDSLHQKIEELEDNKKENEKNLKKYENNKMELENEIKILKRKIETQEDNLNEYEKLLPKMTKESDKQKELIEQHKTKEQNTTKEMNNKVREIQEKNKEIENKNQQILLKEKELQEKGKENEAHKKLIQEQQKMIQFKEREMQKLKNTIEELSKSNETKIKTLTDNKNDIFELRRKIDELEKEKDNLINQTKLFESIFEVLDSKDFNSAMKAIKSLQQKYNCLQDIKHIVNENEKYIKEISDQQLISIINQFKENNNVLNNIIEVMKTSNQNTSQSLIIKDIKKMIKDYNHTKQFAVKIITTLSTHIEPNKIHFPISESKQNTIISLLKMIIKQSKEEHKNLKVFFDEAKVEGYVGYNCLEGLKFIVEKKCNEERNNVINMYKVQFDEIRTILENEQRMHVEDVQKREKIISDLKTAILQH